MTVTPGPLQAICFALVIAGLSADTLPRWDLLPAPPPMPAPERSGFAPVNDISMYYAIYGQGTPLLLIPGGLSSSDVWAAVIPLLDKQHEVVVADSRGQGRSTQTDARLTYSLMASDYLALLDYLRLPRVAVVGWSDGAIIGFDLAIHHPDRLTALFAQAGNASPEGLVVPSPRPYGVFSALKERILAVARAFKRRTLAFLGAPSTTRAPSIALQNEIHELWATEPHYSESELASIRVRTAIAIGDHDDVIRRDHTEYLARTIPGAQLIVLRDVGHPAVLQDPAGYARAVLDFVDASTPSRPAAARQ